MSNRTALRSLDAIKKYGVDTWLSEYKPTLHPDVFQGIYRKIFDAYTEAMLSVQQNKRLYMLAAVNSKVIMTIALKYFYYLTLKELKKQGYTSVNDTESNIEEFLAESKKSDWLCSEIKPVSLQEKLIETAREVKQNINVHGVLKTITGTYKNDCVIIADINEPLLQSYLKRKKWQPSVLRALKYFPMHIPELNQENVADLNTFTDKFFSAFKDESKDFFNTQFKSSFRTLMEDSFSVLQYLSDNLNKQKLQPMIIGEVHHLPSRLLAAAWKLSGGSVTAITHGNAYLNAIFVSGMLHDFAMMIADFHLVGSPGEKLMFDRSQEVKENKITAPAETIISENNVLKHIYEETCSSGAITTVKKIMIVGFPMDNCYYANLPGHDTLTYTHLILNIIKVLKESGYYIIYKAHPDTSSQTDGFFDDYVDEVLNDPFSQVYTQADALVYITPYTTTFGVGILSNIPIVYIDNQDWNVWHPEIKKDLDKRAVSFPVQGNKDGVVQFDPAGLLNCIDESVDRMDYTVVEKFAF